MLRLRRSFSWQHVSSAPHPDFQLQSHIYRHSRLRTSWVHLETKDPHKACAVLFRTTPSDDKGAPHCLEHLVLCGSQHFPVRDPFFSMLSRSLNTYMNAWTGADFTSYPFSTLNSQDFHNLLRVYLDSVLFPLLRDIDFKQEAVRMEFGDKGLAFGGVVFNEMKGAMTEPDSYFLHQLARQLYKGTTYEYNSGGEPEAITKLTNAELKAFHQQFYHPSNATILTYGDMDIAQTQSLVDSEYFHKFSYQEVNSAVAAVPRLSAPLRLKLPCAPSPAAVDPKAQSMFAVSYLCEEPAKDPYTAFCMSVLGSTLHDSQKSPMYLALLESGLGKEYIPGVGFDGSMKEGSFTMGVNGCAEKDVPRIEAAIMATLQQVVTSGIPRDLLESAIHQIEIKQKEVKSNFGLLLLSNMMPFALHGSDPLIPLRINALLDRLRSELAQGKPVFQDLVRRVLLENPHNVVLEMTPDEGFVGKKNEEEARKLKDIEKGLGEHDKERIRNEAETLKKSQDAVQNVDVLPTLTIRDISTQVEQIPYHHSLELDHIPIHFIQQPTNGITYVRLKADITDLPRGLRPLLPMYTRLFNKMGTKDMQHGEFDNLKDLYTTSGISCSTIVSSLKDSLSTHKESLIFSLGFLDRNTHKAFSLLSEVLTRINFSEYSHVNTLIQRSVKARTDDLMSNGISFASSLAASTLTPAANCYEMLGNVSGHTAPA